MTPKSNPSHSCLGPLSSKDGLRPLQHHRKHDRNANCWTSLHNQKLELRAWTYVFLSPLGNSESHCSLRAILMEYVTGYSYITVCSRCNLSLLPHFCWYTQFHHSYINVSSRLVAWAQIWICPLLLCHSSDQITNYLNDSQMYPSSLPLHRAPSSQPALLKGPLAEPLFCAGLCVRLESANHRMQGTFWSFLVL